MPGPATSARTALLALPLAGLLAGAGGARAEATAAGTCAGPTSAGARPLRTIVAPPAGDGVLLGAFPFLGNSEDVVTAERITQFEGLAGRELAWVYASDTWFGGIRFPARSVATIRRTGSVPFLRLMPRSSWREGARDPRYSMQSILAGRHDAALRAWGRAAARSGGPLMVEFATEANGSWFPWSGAWNGGAVTTRYGDRRWPDGPERVRDAYRHVVDVVRGAGARNVTWVLHLDAGSDPAAAWNAPRWYWPGDRYVDWIGLSAYGSQSRDEAVRPLEDVLAPGYRAVSRLSSTRPIALLEFAVADDARSPQDGGRDEAAWTSAAFDAIESGRYPRLRGVAWWHERWTEDDGSVVDLRVDSSPALLDAFRARVANARYVSRARTRCG